MAVSTSTSLGSYGATSYASYTSGSSGGYSAPVPAPAAPILRQEAAPVIVSVPVRSAPVVIAKEEEYIDYTVRLFSTFYPVVFEFILLNMFSNRHIEST